MGLFGKVPSISVSFGKRTASSTSLDRFPTADSLLSTTSSTSDEGDGRGRRRGRSLRRIGASFSHIFQRSRSPSPAIAAGAGGNPRRTNSSTIDKLPRTDSLEGSDVDSVVDITPNNAFESEGEGDAEEDEAEEMEGDDWLDLTKEGAGGFMYNDEIAQLFDPADPESQVIAANTEANSSQITPLEFLQAQAESQPLPFAGQAPNITRPPTEDNPFASVSAGPVRRPPKRSNTAKSEKGLMLHVGRPVYERNRCTIVVSHGNQEKAATEARKTRFYFVASDLSQESQYALEWCIGTCMRQGDECLFMTVMETDSKFDPEHEGALDKAAKIRNQKERQEKASALAREATALLERTKLNVTVTCQAVHAKNARHILVDCIDWLEPTLVIVGSRGLSSLKGTLMGSVSHYLVQKSSVPVMVARRRLLAPPRVYKKRSELDRQARVPLDQAAIEKESHTKQAHTDGDEKQPEGGTDGTEGSAEAEGAAEAGSEKDVVETPTVSPAGSKTSQETTAEDKGKTATPAEPAGRLPQTWQKSQRP